nr:hypothetical protein [uncultured Fluviicola sp.]
MKNRIRILLFLIICMSSGSVEAQAWSERYLFVKIPMNLDFNKYDYELKTSYTNNYKSPVGCSYNFIHKQPGEVFKCKIPGKKGIYEDTLVTVEFIVRNWSLGQGYSSHWARVEVKSDSVFYTIPELPDVTIIDSILRAKEKAERKAYRQNKDYGEDFKDFMTSWDSRFLYVNFYQGNRLFGEVSFSPARYEEVTTSFLSRSTEPGWIRGPVYGAEFNFLWRKDAFILGPKIGFQVTTRYVNLGISGVYYTDFTHGSFCLKPRLGINPGIPWVNFSYEYAIRFGPDVFGNRINSHQFSVYFVIPLKLEEY